MGTREDDSDRRPTAATTQTSEADVATAERHRINHMPGAGSARAAAISAGRHEMLTDNLRNQIKTLAERGLKRPRIGADAVCEALLRQGVSVMFGFPGGVLLPLYDVLGDYPELRHILVRHEQGASHAADGYARASGEVGVCLGTSGPGATNLVTGIGNAMLDSIPMVAITGNVVSSLLGKDAFQEIDITGITIPCTKHNYLVRDPNDIPRVFAEAFHIARTGRPGTGPRRPDEGRPDGRLYGRTPGNRRPARLQADVRGPSPPDQARGPGDRPGPNARSSWPATAS